MRLACHCLNVLLDVIGDNVAVVNKPETLHLSEDAFGDPFFTPTGNNGVAAVVIKDENDVIERLPMLIRKRSLDNWEIRKCLLCNMYTYATNSLTPGRLIVNSKMLSDEISIAERRKSPDYSTAFQVILPKKTTVAPLVDTTFYMAGNASGSILSGANNNNSSSSTVSRYALNVIQDAMAQCLKREQHEMGERIQKFADEQHAAFEQFKTKVKSERSMLLSLIAYHRASDIQSGVYDDEEDENDSAVPLSPLSLRSGDPSPAFLGYQQQQYQNNQNQFFETFATDFSGGVMSRPKALSNPASLTSWKRKRHSGGSGRAPALTSYPEEQQDIFSFEEHENSFNAGEFYHLPADDEDDTDDSGTSSGYFSNYYQTNHNNIDCEQQQIARDYFFTDEFVLGKSLPVTIAPKTIIAAQQQYNNFVDASCNFLQQHQQPTTTTVNDEKKIAVGFEPPAPPHDDVGASMLALARSIRAEDDPERLFGERPHRRRYKTAGDCQVSAAGQQHPPHRLVINVGDRRPSAF